MRLDVIVCLIVLFYVFMVLWVDIFDLIWLIFLGLILMLMLLIIVVVNCFGVSVGVISDINLFMDVFIYIVCLMLRWLSRVIMFIV